ncbi:MAG: septum site-determining protein MinC [Desulfobacterales bacterium]|nr:septum site-determining protein MinC [Desulfobacterales bacterium]
MNSQIKNEQPVRLKGVGDSLWLTINTDYSLDILKNELITLFEKMKHLAVNTKVIIDPGATGHENIIQSLGSLLQAQFKVGNVTGPPTIKHKSIDETLEEDNDTEHIDPEIKLNDPFEKDTILMSGRVRSGQKIIIPKHICILGDVNPGAEIIAGGDIIVLGRLRGTAIAGQPDNHNAIILALDFRPTQLQIGTVVAAGIVVAAGLSPSNEVITEYAHVENSMIVVDTYMAKNPFSKIPNAEIR